MRNILYYLAGTLLLVPRLGKSQNAVYLARTLDSLHQRTAKYAPKQAGKYDQDSVIKYSQQFFQFLASNDTTRHTTPLLLRERYGQNPFLAPVVMLEYTWLSQALTDKVASSINSPAVTQKLAGIQQNTQRLFQLVTDDLQQQIRQEPDSTLRKSRLWRRLYAVSQDTRPAGSAADYPPDWAAATVERIRQALNARLTPRKALSDSISATLEASLIDTKSTTASGKLLYVADSLLSAEKQRNIETIYEDVKSEYRRVDEGLKKQIARLHSFTSQQLVALNQAIGQPLAPLAIPALSLMPSVGLPALREPGLAAPVAAAPATALTAEGALLNGTTAFLADRLKQELNAAFFQRFATLLHDSAYVELQLLFPGTARLLTSGSADYGTVVQTLRGTFEQDLRELLFNYAELLAHEKFYVRSIDPATPGGQLLRYAYILTRTQGYLLHGTHPADLPALLAPDLKRAGLESEGLTKTLGLAQILAGAVTSNELLHRQWLTPAVVARALHTPARQQVFLGLVWERARAQAYLSQRLQQLPLAGQKAEFQQVAANLLALSTQLNEQVEVLRKKAATGRLGAEEFVPLYQTIQQGIDFGRDYTHLAAGSSSTERQQEFIGLCHRINDDLIQGYVAADKGDYGVTLSRFLDIVLLTLASTPPAAVPPAEPAKPATVEALLRQLPQPANSRLLNLPQLVRYGAFMAAVAQARNAADVKAALEAAALPSGSASIKRRSFLSVSVNAFVGATAGGEWAYQAGVRSASDEASLRLALGPTAPIGLSVAWGCRGLVRDRRSAAILAASSRPARPEDEQTKERRTRARLRRLDQAYRYYGERGEERYLRGSAVGLFISVIDLGVPVLLRLSDPQADVLPSAIGFRQVLAPGLFGFYHFRGLPLSAFVGTQFTPQLRELTQLNRTDPTGRLNSMRFNVGLTVDIPLFQLFTRNEPRGVISPKRQQIENQARADEVYCQQLANIAEMQGTGSRPDTTLLLKQLDGLQTQLQDLLQTWLSQRKLASTDAGAEAIRQEIGQLVTNAKVAVRAGRWKRLAEQRALIEQKLAEQLPSLKAVLDGKAQVREEPSGGARSLAPKPVPTLVPPLLLRNY